MEKKKDSGVGGFLGVAGALAALAVLLGLKRRRDEKKKRESEYSDASSSYVSYESYTVSSPCEYPTRSVSILVYTDTFQPAHPRIEEHETPGDRGGSRRYMCN